jgi:hypothetical protein
MTVGHLLFAGVLTAYMWLATFVEERDLVAHFGRVYEEYQRLVPRFVPRLTAAAMVSQASREIEPDAGHGDSDRESRSLPRPQRNPKERLHAQTH